MRQSSLLVIFLIVFIDLVGFGIVIPILPYYAQHFGASGWHLGLLMAAYSLMQFLVAPIWGRISDYVGRRPVLLFSLVGTVLSLVLLGVAGSLKWLFIGRILAGIFGANISTAYAYVADVTAEEDRAKGMGMIGAGFGLGFIFGPAIGGLLSRYGFGFPMFAGALLALGNLIFAFFMLEEPRLSVEMRAANRTRRFSVEAFQKALEDPRARLGIGLFFLVTLAITQMEAVFALYLSARYQYDAESAGILLAVMGAIMVFIQGGMMGRLAPRFGEIKLIVAGAAVSAMALLAFATVNTITLVTFALCAMAVGHGLLHPSLSSLTSLGAPPSKRGMTMGVFHSMGSMARIVGPPCAGWLFDRVSWRSPFFTGSLALAIASVIALLWLIVPAKANRLAEAANNPYLEG
ncbi:MAG: MFS transporter [Oligoflexia bacterium]|nr:MFS transporter [Oligoflexia bacterium]